MSVKPCSVEDCCHFVLRGQAEEEVPISADMLSSR